MTDKLTGSAADFRNNISSLQWSEGWKKEPNGVWMRRLHNGGVIYYSETTKSWWVQGKAAQAAELRAAVTACLGITKLSKPKPKRKPKSKKPKPRLKILCLGLTVRL